MTDDVDQLVEEASRLGRELACLQARLNRLARERRAVVAALREAGCSLGFIAGRLGVTRALVQQWQAHNGRDVASGHRSG